MTIKELAEFEEELMKKTEPSKVVVYTFRIIMAASSIGFFWWIGGLFF